MDLSLSVLTHTAECFGRSKVVRLHVRHGESLSQQSVTRVMVTGRKLRYFFLELWWEAFEVSLAIGVAVRLRSDNQRALFVLRPVRKDDILITYDGPVIDHPTRYSIQIDDNRHIEGTPESNAFLNHSCAPNTYVDWNGPFLRALRDIEAGEELTCNYLTTDWELHEQFVCTCGAPTCFGEIKGFKYLSPEQQRTLEPFIPEFMRKRIAMAVEN